MIFFFILIIGIIYLVLIMPKMLNRRKFCAFNDIYYAHRGLHNNSSNAPENSLEAFKLAVENGYGIELDVQLTKDKIPIVFHDANLKRVCGIDKNVRELTFNELQELKLFNSDKQIPLFTDVINIIKGRVPLIVEYKAKGNDTEVCDILAPILDSYEGVYCIESFNPLILMWYKKSRPQVIRGQLSTNYLRGGVKNDRLLNFLLQNLLFNIITKPDFIAFNHKYSNMLSLNICRILYKIPTFAYTIGSMEDLMRNKKKFDYFIFEGFIPK